MPKKKIQSNLYILHVVDLSLLIVNFSARTLKIHKLEVRLYFLFVSRRVSPTCGVITRFEKNAAHNSRGVESRHGKYKLF